MNPIPLVSFLLVRDKKVLMEIRKPTAMGAGETWFPGGHVEEGETNEHALLREMKEEVNVQPLRYHLLITLPWSRNGKAYAVHYYVCPKWNGEIENKEGANFIWVDYSDSSKLTDEIDRIVFRKLMEEI